MRISRISSAVFFVALIAGAMTGAGRDMNSAADIVVTDHDNASVVTMARHQKLVVRLEAQPGTGYSWEPEAISILRFASAEVEDGSGALGGSVTQKFVFVAIASGEEQLAFSYRRPWEKGAEPARKFAIRVKVTT